MSRFRVLAGLAGVAALLANGTAQADLYGAEQAYNNKDFAKAFALYRELAEMGHPLAQESLAVMYVNAEGVNRDNVLGYGWAVIANENARSDIAQNIISQIEPHMTDAARKRVAELQARFGKAALQESLLPVLPDPSVKLNYKPDPDNCTFSQPANPDDYYPTAAIRQGMSGNVELEYTVMPDGRAHYPRVVIGVPPGAFDQPAKSVIFNSRFKPKKVNGVAVPCRMRVRVKFQTKVSTGDSRNPALVKTMAEARKKALAGDPLSQLTYALLLQGLGSLTEAPPESAISWNLKAAQAGLPTAQFMVGSFLLNTTSASVDERKALVWLTKAADAGQTNAQVDLANYLLEKADDPGSRARAFELLDQAAGTDNLEAKYRLAALLASDPDASRRDPARALELLEKVMSGKEIDPTTLEVRAAARAMIGDFKAALADEEHAIRLATRYGWDLAPLEARHALYEKGAPWTGDLLAP